MEGRRRHRAWLWRHLAGRPRRRYPSCGLCEQGGRGGGVDGCASGPLHLLRHGGCRGRRPHRQQEEDVPERMLHHVRRQGAGGKGETRRCPRSAQESEAGRIRANVLLLPQVGPRAAITRGGRRVHEAVRGRLRSRRSRVGWGLPGRGLKGVEGVADRVVVLRSTSVFWTASEFCLLGRALPFVLWHCRCGRRSSVLHLDMNLFVDFNLIWVVIAVVYRAPLFRVCKIDY